MDHSTKPQASTECPSCGSTNTIRERKPNGNSVCVDCRYTNPSLEWDRENQAKANADAAMEPVGGPPVHISIKQAHTLRLRRPGVMSYRVTALDGRVLEPPDELGLLRVIVERFFLHPADFEDGEQRVIPAGGAEAVIQVRDIGGMTAIPADVLEADADRIAEGS